MPVAPSGLVQVHLSDGTSNSANEVGLSTAIMSFAMANNRTDVANLSVMGVSGAAHGCSVATLSCSDSKANIGAVPTYDWPSVDLPDLKMPYAKHEPDNFAEEERCLDQASKIVNERRAAGKDIAAIIVEPLSSLEMKNATPNFYKGLRRLAKTEGIPFIVDETKTGMGQTGKMWAHDHWFLQDKDGGCPDIVTFGGKTGISGFYSTYDFRLNPHCASFEQNLDLSQVLTFGVTWRYIQSRSLLQYVGDTSSFLKIELENASRDTGNIGNVRGLGTAIAFDCFSSEHADSMHKWLLKRGIVTARVGQQSIGLRPALVLGTQHAANLREAVRQYHVNHD